jgi:hypothetical protein
MSTQVLNASPAKWYRRVARFGLISKGVVYCISGIMALLVALHLAAHSPKDAGKKQMFSFISDQPMGKLFLVILIIGLTCYTCWRWLLAFKDTGHKGKNKEGLAKRFTYFANGMVYASVTFYAIKILIGNSGGGDSRQEFVSKLLSQPYGQWLVAIVAAVMTGIGFFQVYRAASGKYKKYVRSELHKDAAPWIATAGIAGYTARGIVWLVIGWLFIKAALHHNSKEVGGTDKVFSWLHSSSYGSWLLGIVAAGLVCYGIFMFLRAKYQRMKNT